MRIAQVAPLAERVPPVAYGGTERVVSYLTEALVTFGHTVTLFASGDSRTRARLVPITERALRLDAAGADALAHEVRQVEIVAGLEDAFDIIHFHTGHVHLPVARRLRTPSVTTMHGRLDGADVGALMREFSDAPLVSISESQRQPLLDANWCGTVYHGMPPRLLPFSPRGGRGLLFLGRISREKRVDRAIEIARRAGRELRIAAKVDAADRDYFVREIEPLLRQPGVTFVGEVGEREKATLLADSAALLFPIDWPEPFGMVVIEALSVGTPVIAWDHGSVPELLDHGVTGWIVESIGAAVDAVRHVDLIDRRACRAAFERRFTAARMALDYVALYQRLAAVAGQVNVEARSA